MAYPPLHPTSPDTSAPIPSTTGGTAGITQPRRVVDQLPARIGILPGEMDLVASFLVDFVPDHIGSA